mmetsp:Transcript_25211/g.22341  ORF Transcript_25211/g.22341 Transcript_25211/m.22341 type:complete len:104 (+) Transcript_25211:219-530(+)
MIMEVKNLTKKLTNCLLDGHRYNYFELKLNLVSKASYKQAIRMITEIHNFNSQRSISMKRTFNSIECKVNQDSFRLVIQFINSYKEKGFNTENLDIGGDNLLL